MADGDGGNIKGISIAVTANASQIKSVFNAAIQGFADRTIAITLTAKEDKSFARIFAALRNQNVEIGVSLKPTRQSIRDFRKDFNERLAREGSITSPMKIKPFTKTEGTKIRQAIQTSIGTPVVDVILNWKWGKNGPPPTGFQGSITGGGGGGGGVGGFGGEARGPIVPDIHAAIRAEVAKRMGAAERAATGGTGGVGSFQRAAQQPRPSRAAKQEEEDEPRQRRAPRRPHRYDQKPGETPEAWQARLLGAYQQAIPKLQSKSPDVATRANNALVQLEKRLKMESDRQYIPPPGRGVRSRVGKVTTLEPTDSGERPARSTDGKLVSDLAEEIRKSGLGPSTSPTAQRSALQKQYGVKIGPEGVTNLGTLGAEFGATSAQAQNRLIERINARLFDHDRVDQPRAPGVERAERELMDMRRQRTELEGRLKVPMRSAAYRGVVQAIAIAEPSLKSLKESFTEGYRGGGRAGRSLASERGKGFEDLERGIKEVAPRGPSSRINMGRIDSDAFIQAFVDEITNDVVRRPDFRQDKGQIEEFKKRWAGSAGTGPWGESFARGQAFMQQGHPTRALFGERRYNAETGHFDIVPAGQKLPSGEESTGFEGVIPARAQLDALARGRKLPGVSAAAVRYAQAAHRNDIPSGKYSQQGLDYIAQRDALTAIANTVFEQRRVTEQQEASTESGRKAAETVKEARNAPIKARIPKPIVAPRGAKEAEEVFAARAQKAEEEHQRLVAAEDARYAKAVGKYEARVQARVKRDAAKAATAPAVESDILSRDPMLREFQSAEAGVTAAQAAVTSARSSPSPRVDPKLVEYLNRQRGGKGLTNLEKLRGLSGRLTAAAGTEKEMTPANIEAVRKQLASAKLVGKAPAGFARLQGELTSIQTGFTGDPTSFSNPAVGRTGIGRFASLIGQEPEVIASSLSGPPDPAKVAATEAALRQARINRVTVGRQRLRARRAAATAAAAPQQGPQDLPDLSDLGFTREQVMAAFAPEHLAQAAGGIAAPPPSGPVPPGTVAGGGGLGGHAGGIVPVRVTNWPSRGSGRAEAEARSGVSEPTASIGGRDVTLAEALAKPGAMKGGPLGARGATFGKSDPELDKAKRAVDNVARALATRRHEPGADLESILKRSVAVNQRLAELQGPGSEDAVKAAEDFKRELEGVQGAKAAARPPKASTEGPRGSLRSQLLSYQRAGALSQTESEAILARGPATGVDELLAGAGTHPASVREEAIRTAREQLAQARQGLPIRAFPQSVATLVAGPGKGAATARFAQGEKLLGRAAGLEPEITKLADEYAGAEKALGNINAQEKQGVTLTKEQVRLQQQLPPTLLKIRGQLADTVKLQQQLTVEGAKLAQLTGPEKFANLGKSLLGSITGTLAYGTALGAVVGTLGAVGAAMVPVLERSSGYKQTTAELTSELAKQNAAQGTSVDTLTAQRLAMTNMTKAQADQIKGTISSRASIMATNEQLTEQQKLYASAAEIQKQNLTGLGPRGGGRTRYGSDVNLYESTGGILNSSINAPGFSTQEALGHAFETAAKNLQEQAAGAGGVPASQVPFSGILPQNITRDIQMMRGGLTDKSYAGLKVPPELQEFAGALKAVNKELVLSVATTDEQRKKVEQFADALDAADFQEAAKSVRGGRFFVQGLDQQGSLEQQAKVVTKGMENWQRGVVQRDPAQLIAGMGDQINAAVQGSLDAARIERKLVMPAQRDLANLANPVLPFSQQSLLGSPAGGRSDLMTSILGRQGVGAGAQPEVKRAAFTTMQAQQRQATQEAEALPAIHELFKPLGAGVEQEYLKVRSNIKEIGSELAGLQNEQVNIQVNLSMEQFNEQLRQVRRSLADARERAGQGDQPGNDNLGLLERQGILLSRQSAAVGFQQTQLGLQSQALQLQNQLLGRKSQLLQFHSTELGFQSKQLSMQSTAIQLAQNQRQINFQVAAAGFTAPGTTPEERAARIAEARAEANVAQQQQNIAVKQFAIEQQQFAIEQSQYGIAQQQFGIDAQQLAIQQQSYVLAQQQYGLSVAQFNNQQAIIDAQNARAIEDLGIQERLIGSAMAATNALAANEKTISNLRTALEQEMATAASYLGQASGVATQISQTSASLISQFGGDLNKIATAYAAAWASFRSQAMGAMRQPYAPNQDFSGYAGSGYYNAPGAIGMVSAPTKMVVGDAGGEMVAILRNPKPMAVGVGGLGGGGGNTYLSVTVTGNSVRNDDDLDKIAALVGRKVEETLGRRASQLGFRTAR